MDNRGKARRRDPIADLRELIAKYGEYSAAGGHKELEMRFGQLPWAQVAQAVMGLGEPTIEYSLNIIADLGRGPAAGRLRGSAICQILFSGKDKQSTAKDFSTKESLMRPVKVMSGPITYSVALSMEKSAAPEILPAAGQGSNYDYRLKVRLSFPFEKEDLKWRADLTAIRQRPFEEIRTGAFKPGLFFMGITPMTREKFASMFGTEEAAKEAGIDRIELELELMAGNPTAEKLTAATEALIATVFAGGKAGADMGVGAATATYRRTIAAIIGHKGREVVPTLKQMLNAAVSPTKAEYAANIFPLKGYFLTEKANGVRAVALLYQGATVIVGDSLLEVSGSPTGGPTSALDGEWVPAEKGGKFYAFDCLFADGQSVVGMPFEERKEALGQVVAASANPAIVAKKYVRLDPAALKKQIEAAWGAKYPYDIDGLIFTESGKPYRETANWKWKPMEQNTIDFFAVKCPANVRGQPPYMPKEGSDLYLLFCGVSSFSKSTICIEPLPFFRDLFEAVDPRYMPVHFACPFDPLAYLYYHPANSVPIDRKIVEMRRDRVDSPWILMKIREDRVGTWGNNYGTAVKVFSNYVNPFPLEALWNPSAGYFAEKGEIELVASNKLRRFALTILLYDEVPKPGGIVLDLGGGRGADFVRYATCAGASWVINVDNDAGALTESVSRYLSAPPSAKSASAHWLINMKRRHRAPGRDAGCASFKYSTVKADLAAPEATHDQLAAAIGKSGISAGSAAIVMSTFAFHYFCGSLEVMRRTLRLIGTFLKAGGIAIISTMSGEKVHKLLTAPNVRGKWEVRDEGAAFPRYSIGWTAPMGDTPAPAGQMIKVSVPFAEELYEEPLCNFSAVIAEAKKVGLMLRKRIAFGEFINMFKSAEPALASRLVKADLEYNDLFEALVFTRVAE